MSGAAKLETPEFIETYEETVNVLKSAHVLYEQFVVKKNKRITMQFGDTRSLDVELEGLSKEATNKLMQCETNLRIISQYNNPKQTENDKKVRRNMQRALAAQIQELTIKFRKQEKSLYDCLRKFNGDFGDSPKSTTGLKTADTSMNNGDMQVSDMDLQEVESDRDEQVNNVVETINKLSQLFKQLNQLVIDQGTILDRIDYNIEQSLTNVQKANKSLTKADEYQKNNKANICIKMLIGMIVFFTIILILKYTRKQPFRPFHPTNLHLSLIHI
eukprot:TRINITY_DN2509_c0_g1_i5.p1 TRINITY_DN2509_c0_g1~~TRINITY_DN2509_c0_g1_i5.p1  ORF type:complete len:273 (-),score=69.51 TRINITY_DN2509_c0_g1_i5:62-880(-)